MLSKERKAMERYHHYYDRFDLLFVITSKIIFKGKVTQSDTAIGAGQGNGCEKIANNRRQFNKHTNEPKSIQAHAKDIQKHAQTCKLQSGILDTQTYKHTQTGTIHTQSNKQVLDTHKLTTIHTNRYWTHKRSRELEQGDLVMFVQTKSEYIQDKLNVTWIEAQFLKEALDVLVCRLW